MSEFEKDLAELLNRHSLEHLSGSPDWLLAQYLAACLATFNFAIQQRENFYGREPRPTEIRREEA